MNPYKKAVLATCVACILPAQAAPIQLKFEGLSVTTQLNGQPDTRDVRVDDFYNGGKSKKNDGSDANVKTGPSLGVVFGKSAVGTASTDTGGELGTFLELRKLSIEGVHTASTALGTGALYAFGVRGTDSSVTLDFAGGFSGGLSFFYNAANTLEVRVRDANANVIGITTLGSVPVCSEQGNTRCIWSAAALDFQGSATTVEFSGTAYDFLIDNLTLGSLDPLNASAPPIPEPSTYALMALGLAGLGFAATKRRSTH